VATQTTLTGKGAVLGCERGTGTAMEPKACRVGTLAEKHGCGAKGNPRERKARFKTARGPGDSGHHGWGKKVSKPDSHEGFNAGYSRIGNSHRRKKTLRRNREQKKKRPLKLHSEVKGSGAAGPKILTFSGANQWRTKNTRAYS